MQTTRRTPNASLTNVKSFRPELEFEIIKAVLLREGYLKRMEKQLKANGGKVDVSIVGLVDVVREWSKDVIRGGFTDEYAMLEFSREWFRQRAGLPAGGGGGPPAAGTGAGAALDAGKGTRLHAVDAQAQARRDKEEAEAHTARAEGATEAEVEEERIAAYVYEAEEVEAEGALAAAVAAGTPAAGGKEPAASPTRASSFDFAKGTFVFG